uniref:DNA-directed RNA polymerases I and III subunit RPAC2 n=1 Tax=Salvator merianae TaxID=96440 RepID=A0A8D0BNK8_SALMN
MHPAPLELVCRKLRLPASSSRWRWHRLPGLCACCSRMGDEEEQKKPPVLQMVRADGPDKSCITFVLHNEDHTLGNSLRYMIMKDPEVEFCGYSITHPSESKINFRIQTREGIPAVEKFQKGLEELMGVCQHVLNKFEASMEVYKAQQDVNME